MCGIPTPDGIRQAEGPRLGVAASARTTPGPCRLVLASGAGSSPVETVPTTPNARPPTHQLNAVSLANQRAIMVQDLLHAEGNRRNLILKRHMPRRANHQAERSRTRVTKAKQRGTDCFPVEERSESAHSPAEQVSGQVRERAKGLRRDHPARNLNLETRYRLISLNSDNPVQFVLSEFLLKKSNHRVRRARPKF